MGLADRLTK